MGAGFAVAIVADLLLFLGGLLALIGGATMPSAARRHPMQAQAWPGYPSPPGYTPPGQPAGYPPPPGTIPPPGSPPPG